MGLSPLYKPLIPSSLKIFVKLPENNQHLCPGNFWKPGEKRSTHSEPHSKHVFSIPLSRSSESSRTQWQRHVKGNTKLADLPSIIHLIKPDALCINHEMDGQSGSSSWTGLGTHHLFLCIEGQKKLLCFAPEAVFSAHPGGRRMWL